MRIQSLPLRLSDEAEATIDLLLEQLVEIKARYLEEAEPIRKRLADIESQAVFHDSSSSGSVSP